MNNKEKLKQLYFKDKKTFVINENLLDTNPLQNKDLIIEDYEINNRDKIDLFHYPFLNKCCDDINYQKKYNLIIYNITSCEKNKFTQFLFNFQDNQLNFLQSNYYDRSQLQDNLNLTGICVRGKIAFKNKEYLFIQCKQLNNSLNSIWATKYDIIFNKKIFHLNFNYEVVDFFLANNTIDNLFYNNKLTKQPVILYNLCDKQEKKIIVKFKKRYLTKYLLCYNLSNISLPLKNNELLVRYICFLNNKNEYLIKDKKYYILNLNNTQSSIYNM